MAILPPKGRLSSTLCVDVRFYMAAILPPIRKVIQMEKIASFQVDHLRLNPGVYVSRKDKFGDTVFTTFDLRYKKPNKEPVIDQPALHTIEHLGATFLRSNKEWSGKTLYFGPMGCRTGFYLILEG